MKNSHGISSLITWGTDFATHLIDKLAVRFTIAHESQDSERVYNASTSLDDWQAYTIVKADELYIF